MPAMNDAQKREHSTTPCVRAKLDSTARLVHGTAAARNTQNTWPRTMQQHSPALGVASASASAPASRLSHAAASGHAMVTSNFLTTGVTSGLLSACCLLVTGFSVRTAF